MINQFNECNIAFWLHVIAGDQKILLQCSICIMHDTLTQIEHEYLIKFFVVTCYFTTYTKQVIDLSFVRQLSNIPTYIFVLMFYWLGILC